MTSAHTTVTQARLGPLGILLHLDKNVTGDNLLRFPLAGYTAEY